MKPIKLTMSAFGPYADVQTLDMTLLGNTGLYAITGETGAGKTTIFDAMFYALYGKANDPDKGGDNLISSYAQPHTETYVEMVFLCGGKEYTIRRSQSKGKVALTFPDGKVLTKKTEVGKAIEEDILGVDAQQFSQIVMIAQGEFRKLIQAKSSETTRILRKIFSTGKYDDIAVAFQEEVKKKAEKLKETRGAIQTLVETLEAEEGSPLAEEKTKDKDSLLIEDVLQLAAQLLQADEEAHKAAKELVKEKGRIRDRTKSALEMAKKVQENRKELIRQQGEALLQQQKQVELKQAKQEAESHSPEIEELAGRITILENEKPEYSALEALLKELEQARSDWEQALKDVSNTKQRLEDASKEKERLSGEAESIGDTSQRLSQVQRKLEELSERQRRLNELSKRLDDLAKASKAREDALACEGKARKQEETAQADMKALRREGEELKDAAPALVQCRSEIEKLKKDVDDNSDLQKDVAKWLEAKANAAATDSAYLKARDSAEEKQRAARELRRQYNDNIAGVLADGLSDGQPCPVCGSLHHPHPARQSCPIDLAEVDEAEAAGERAQKEANELARTAESSKAALKTLQEALLPLMEGADEGDWKRTAEAKGLKLKAHLTELLAQLPEYEAAEKRAKAIHEELLPQAESLYNKALRNRITCEGNRETAKQAELSAEKEVLHSTEGLMPEGRSKEDVLQAEEDTRQQIQQQQEQEKTVNADIKRTEAIKKRLAELEETLQTLNTTLQGSLAAEARDKILCEEKEAQAREKQEKLSCESAEAADREIKKMKLQQELLRQKIEECTRNLQELLQEQAATEGKIATLTEQLREAPENDVEGLTREANNAQAALDSADNAERRLDKRLTNNRNAKDRLEELIRNAKASEAQFRMMQEVANTAAGRVNGSHKISLESFAQAALFDRILRYANLRLRKMSREQYELVRRPAEEGTGGGRTGLEMDVFDHYNGTRREIGTLSGGEGFLASMALALGMSDAIQNSASLAVRLDTMFVDEGFGSLSSNFLDLAMDELVETAAGGNRLIGIISHVDEVKNRMDKRIEVTKLPTGGSVAKIR